MLHDNITIFNFDRGSSQIAFEVTYRTENGGDVETTLVVLTAPQAFKLLGELNDALLKLTKK